MVAAMDTVRSCQRCGDVKPIADFKRNRWGSGAVCNACVGRKMTLAAVRRRSPDDGRPGADLVAELERAQRCVRDLEQQLTAAEDARDRLVRRLARMSMVRPVGRRAKRLGLPGSEHAR